ncbi:MAG: GNAT family N-acetyltransferase [Methylococcales bacterium]|nr:GNAT family N-acetyltransferase [Methylococcales bacterium]
MSLQKALHHLQVGESYAAEQLCLALCTAQPENADTLQLLAIIYARSQRPAEASAHFLKAIALAPERADFYGNYANLLWEMGRTDDTIHCCQQAIAKHSNRPEVYNTLGNAFFRSGQFQAASDSYKQAIALQPDYAEAHNNLGQAFKAQQHYSAAEQCFRTALALLPNFEQALTNLEQVDSAWLLLIAGNSVALQRFQTTDAAFLQSCYQDKAFMRLYNQLKPATTVTELTEKIQAENQQHPSQNHAVNWIIQHQRFGAIGIANLVDINLSHRRAEILIGIPEVSNRYSGAGLTATLLVMDFAFNRLRLNKLLTFIYSDNAASIKNNVSLGFSRESYLKQHLKHPETGQYIDLCGNAIMADEFHSNKRLAKLSQRLLGRDITGALFIAPSSENPKTKDLA